MNLNPNTSTAAHASSPEPGCTAALRIAAVADEVTSLGPPPAAVLWTQGCGIGCRGCMSHDTWSPLGGVIADVADVAVWLRSRRCRSLVLSGGEPTEQPAALNSLLDLLDDDWVVTLYSGRDWSDLLAEHDDELARLVRRVDLAIVGPYRRDLHADLLWRASSNQRIIDVSGRVTLPQRDRSAGVAVRVRRNDVTAIGVPPRPDFDRHLRRELAASGVELRPLDRPDFPFPVRHQEA